VSTLVGWEIGRHEPTASYIPAILGFIGYDPLPEDLSFGDRLRTERHRLGLTQRQLARKLGIGNCTVSRLETGGEIKDERVLAVVRGFLDGTADR
jgi:transcriptional regulator with XRE-family HTH domain